ncbi:hypothetical protein E2C01_036311 [Portunus trituberculatus]|uniref:Uncharacterized protein n=1 Tax=Portunus trituberculatus TaxID=210409 RepID=A0A5B7FDW0_PORTR|nr:hypothetical protein [Portunus trituberculatus]
MRRVASRGLTGLRARTQHNTPTAPEPVSSRRTQPLTTPTPAPPPPSALPASLTPDTPLPALTCRHPAILQPLLHPCAPMPHTQTDRQVDI